MLDSNDLPADLYANYVHYLANIDEINYDGERPHLTCEDVLDAHYLICAHFMEKGEGIGGFGPKDFGLLSSAVARQISSAGGAFVYQDIWEIAASLLFGLINDHPFHDANKRTAFLSVVFFMLQHDFTPSTEIVEVEDFTVEIAESHSMTGKFITIDEVSRRLRRLFRKNDNRIAYIVTFNELQQLLSAHGCSIAIPDGNYINVYKGEDRVARIGFPGWSRQVTRNAISTVRKATGLTSENGYDAQVFFKGADPLSALIGEYEEPLRRLAYR